MTLVAGLLVACASAPDTMPAPDTGSVPATSPEPLTPAEGAGLAVLSYLDNYLVRLERDDWTAEEGMEKSLRLLIGAVSPSTVLLQRPVASRDVTGLIAAGRESVEGTGDTVYRARTDAVLELLVFDSEQLESMTLDPSQPPPTLPPAPTPSGPLPTVGSVDVASEPPVVPPTFDTDCQRFFRRFPVGEGTERCLTMRTATAGELPYIVYAPAPSLAPFGWEPRHHVLIDEALAETMAVYSELGELPRITVVLAVNLDVPSDAATIVDDGDCRIMIYTDAQRRSDIQFKQVIAQQMAHCLQAETFPDQQGAPYTARRWREDGLAGYLSGLVYPEGGLEREPVAQLATIDDTSSLLEWSAASAAWWQYVANEGGWDAIREIVTAMPDEGDLADQAAALAGYPGIAELFTGFAEAFTDGSIAASSGEAIPSAWQPSFEEEGAAVSAAGVVSSELLAPFSLVRRLLVVPIDLRAQLTTDGADDIVVRTRPLSGGGWSSLPQAFPTDCASDVRLVIIATSTAAQSQDVRLSIDELSASGC